MNLEIMRFELGPAITNSYLLADAESKMAVVIDPAWDGDLILAKARERGWQVNEIWITHAHFDHFGGAGDLADGFDPPPAVALHPDDLWLWEAKGGVHMFGLDMQNPGPAPTISLAHGKELKLGGFVFEVLHAPGHTPGHTMFYCQSESILFCGDVIFQRSIGRTDLPRGDHQTLLESIRTQVLTLPDETRLLSGHGPETTVGEERKSNPFLG